MNNNLQHALVAASLGFYVHPLKPMSKEPALTGWQKFATRDEDQISEWWSNGHTNSNIGIFTGRFNENEALIVVDIDESKEKMGENEFFRLENIEGLSFPDTLEQKTPSGGRHLIYRTKQAVKQGVNVLAPGIDIRSRGGNLAFAGSRLINGDYILIERDIAEAPEWLVTRLGISVSKTEEVIRPGLFVVNRENAISRATYYLKNIADISVEGNGGDANAFIVACRVKDFGVQKNDCFDLLSDLWNKRCQPPWSNEQLRKKINNAYTHGVNKIGSDSPEHVFKPQEIDKNDKTLSPIEELNKEYAFIIVGGNDHIIWETTDHKGKPKIEHIGIDTFHRKNAALKISFGEVVKPLTKVWISSPDRRSYDGLCFMPNQKSVDKFYNLWRGFSVEPSKELLNDPYLNDFLSHAKENICMKDEGLFNWLMAYCAHLIQTPWKKVRTALVFKGAKGVGKNFFIEQIGELLGSHYKLTANPRYLLGNFNGHLENCLMFVLDELLWAGDKKAEGILKDLITGREHLIERKGIEPYTVANCTRVVLISNEEWVIPASADERRFAVFNVGEGKKQNTSYFSKLRKGLNAGSNKMLLRYLMDFDLKGIDLDTPPKTEGLFDQKISSLEPVHDWWLNCLTEGYIIEGDFGGEIWPINANKNRLKEAFQEYAKKRRISGWSLTTTAFTRSLKKCLPSRVIEGQEMNEGERQRIYKLPNINDCRASWNSFIGFDNFKVE